MLKQTWKHFEFTCAVLVKVVNGSLSLAQYTGNLLGLATLALSVVAVGAGNAVAQAKPGGAEPQARPEIIKEPRPVGPIGGVKGPDVCAAGNLAQGYGQD